MKQNDIKARLRRKLDDTAVDGSDGATDNKSKTATTSQPYLRRSQSSTEIFMHQVSYHTQKSFKHEAFDRIAKFIMTWLGDKGVSLLVPLVFVFSDFMRGSLFYLSVGLCSSFCNMIKWYFIKPRPHWKHINIKNFCGHFEKDYSFPSGHTQVTTFIFTFIFFAFLINDESWYSSLLSIFAVSLMILTGFTRIYLGVHFITDVVCGWIIGFVFAFILCSIDQQAFIYGLKLDQNVAWMCCFSVFMIYPIFMMIRKLSPDPDVRLRRKWIENIHLNFDNVDEYNIEELLGKRELRQLHLQTWSVFGTMISITVMNNNDDLRRYLFESCGNHDWNIKLMRASLGYIPFFLVIFPVAFLVPRILRKRGSIILSHVFECVAGMMAGVLWCFVPVVVDALFGYKCSVDVSLWDQVY